MKMNNELLNRLAKVQADQDRFIDGQQETEVWQRKTLSVNIKTPNSLNSVPFTFDYLYNDAKEYQIEWPETACGFVFDDLKEIFELYVEADLNGGEVPLKSITYTKEQAVNNSRIISMLQSHRMDKEIRGRFIDPIGLKYSFLYSNPTDESTLAALPSIFSQIIF
jgi:hypothetical protein